MTAAVTDLLNGAAALQLGQARTAADRIAAMADTPDPVRRPDRPFPPPERPVTISISGGSVTYPGQDTPAVIRVGGVYDRLWQARRCAGDRP